MSKPTQRGIQCPKCSSFDLDVMRTRRGPGVIIRFRRCRKCGYAGPLLRTKERLIGDQQKGPDE